LGQPGQPSGEPASATPYVPKRAGTSWIVAIVLLVVGVLLGSAVGYYVIPRPSPPTLVVIGPWAGPERDAFLPVLAAFEARTGIDVTYRIYRQEALTPLLPVQFGAKETPGDVIFMVSSFIKAQGPLGNAVDVTDLVTPSNFKVGATSGTNLLAPVTDSGGKIWGGIYTGKVKPGFWYRQSFFTAHGLSPPTTWAEFQALLGTIAGISGVRAPIVSGDGVGWPLSDVAEHFIATYGGASMHRGLSANKTNQAMTWTDPQVRAVFANRLVPLLQAGRFGEPLTADNAALTRWWNGEFALYFMGSWIGNWLLGLNLSPAPDLKDLRVFPLPSESGITPGVVFAADYMFIPKYTSRLAEARQLFSFLLSAEGQSAQAAQGGHVATRIGVANGSYPPGDLAVVQSLAGKEVLADLDDTIGGDFQQTFWTELKGLWTNPGQNLDAWLGRLQAAVPP
jgi:multiple sugar transport system substrate-binding protein